MTTQNLIIPNIIGAQITECTFLYIFRGSFENTNYSVYYKGLADEMYLFVYVGAHTAKQIIQYIIKAWVTECTFAYTYI